MMLDQLVSALTEKTEEPSVHSPVPDGLRIDLSERNERTDYC